MKKLALTAFGVAIVLVGLMTALYFCPCTKHCEGDRDRCEMKDSTKCPGQQEGCKEGEGKCSGHHEGCEKEGNQQGGCSMEGNQQGGCKMEGNQQGGCKMEGNQQGGCKMEGNQQGGGACSMQGANQGCCCCIMMMNACKAKCDSMKADTAHCKVRCKM
jgi:hypothetical protein